MGRANAISLVNGEVGVENKKEAAAPDPNPGADRMITPRRITSKSNREWEERSERPSLPLVEERRDQLYGDGRLSSNLASASEMSVTTGMADFRPTNAALSVDEEIRSALRPSATDTLPEEQPIKPVGGGRVLLAMSTIAVCVLGVVIVLYGRPSVPPGADGGLTSSAGEVVPGQLVDGPLEGTTQPTTEPDEQFIDQFTEQAIYRLRQTQTEAAD